MRSIKTGVDRLVELISQKKKIELEDASKQLGLGTNVVQDWAQFLEQEGLITIEYTFSKVWLHEKKITKDDVVGAAKEVSSQKDAFIRKIDVALKSLDTETMGFEDIRKHFLDIQSHIKNEIDTVKTELDELQKYELLKKNLDKDIASQKKDYEKLVNGYVTDIKNEEQKYVALLSEIDKEKKVLESYKQKIDELNSLKEESEKIVATSKESLRNIEKSLADGSLKIGVSEKRLLELRNMVDKISVDINTKKNKNIGEALAVIQAKSNKTIKEQDELFMRAQEKTNKLSGFSDTGRKIYDSFKGFFLKNIETEKLVSSIEDEKNSLIKDMQALKSKVESFNFIAREKDVKSQMKEIEESVKSFEKRKSGLKVKVEKLIELIKGGNSK